ncbi:MAG: hypothetical protein IKW98_06585 [Prevotella sp.]|nr:hypothetical protein [Prevotella sp.]
MKQRIFMMLAAMLLSIGAFAQSGNEPLKGDVNEDGRVDVADIVAIVDIIMKGGSTPQPTTYYWYVGTELPDAVDTNNIKSSAAEIGWHYMDVNTEILNVGQCVVDVSSNWYILIPVINDSAFTKVLSMGVDVTWGFEVSSITIAGQQYTLFYQIEPTKKFKYNFSK